MRFDKRLPVAIVTAAGLVLGAVAPGSVMEANAASAKTRVGSSAAGQRVKLGLNKSIVLDLPSDAYDILVANPAVADAVTRTARNATSGAVSATSGASASAPLRSACARPRAKASARAMAITNMSATTDGGPAVHAGAAFLFWFGLRSDF